MRVIIKFLSKILAIILYRPKIIGKENLPKEGAAIICPNHVHALDGPAFIAMAKRKVNVLAKEGMFKGRIGKWFTNLFGIYEIKQDSADISAVKISLKLLKNNELLLIFPEGTRNGMAKGKKPKNGPVTLAIKAGVPIIPVGVQGDFRLFRKVKMNIGKPIDYTQYKKDVSNKELISELTNSLMGEIVKLRDDFRDGEENHPRRKRKEKSYERKNQRTIKIN